MSCPTCSRPMKNVGVWNDANSVFWCELCGTIRFGDEHSHVPKVVDRVRSMETHVLTVQLWWRDFGNESVNTLLKDLLGEWRDRGLAEVTTKPQDRKT